MERRVRKFLVEDETYRTRIGMYMLIVFMMFISLLTVFIQCQKDQEVGDILGRWVFVEPPKATATIKKNVAGDVQIDSLSNGEAAILDHVEAKNTYIFKDERGGTITVQLQNKDKATWQYTAKKGTIGMTDTLSMKKVN